MIKTILPDLFSFDVEWIPDPAAASLLYGTEISDVRSYESAMQKLWQENGATEDNPQPYLKTVLCRIVSIAGIYRHQDSKGVQLKLVSLPSDVTVAEKCHESAILTAFFKAVGGKSPQLVGYNSANADLPIIVQRGIVNGLMAHGVAKRPNKPWEGIDYFSGNDAHVDLATILGRYGQIPSLNQIARLSGIPGKMDVDGYAVADMWLRGDIQGIINYNEFDAFTTHLLWARVAYFAELLTDKQYADEQRLVRELLEEEAGKGKKHLLKYVEEWDRLQQATAKLYGAIAVK